MFKAFLSGKGDMFKAQLKETAIYIFIYINNQMRKGLTAEVQNERRDGSKIRIWACHFYSKL